MKGMSIIVKTIARWVKVFILLFGIYLTLTGHLTPGGGFAGGVIIACLYILLILAYGKESAFKSYRKTLISSLDSIGVLIFLLLAILGIGFGGIFFNNFIQELFPGKDFNLLNAGTIPFNNFAICIKVAASILLVFVVMAVLRIVDKDDDTKNYIQKEEEE
jgi:multisubunit Na+/H+ antiporter MnhB subunit